MDEHQSVFLQAIVLLLSIIGQHVAGNKVFILPTQDSPCPIGESCFTLQQYVRSLRGNPIASANTTLELQPGVHSLDSALSVSGVSSFRMKGINAQVDCPFLPSVQKFKFSFIDTVHLDGINFVNCGQFSEPHINGVDLFIFENCDFHSSNPLYVSTSSSAVILNSTFSGNAGGALKLERTTSVTIKQCTFFNNMQAFGSSLNSHGGAVLAVDSTVSVSQTIFRNNQASGDGAAIRISSGQGDKTLTIVDSNFTNNNAAFVGGRGGAVYSAGASVMVSGCNFTSNGRGGQSAGGAINVFGTFANLGLYLVVSDSSFTENTGRAIHYASSSPNIDLDNTTLSVGTSSFTSNENGAVYSESASVVVEQSTFSYHNGRDSLEGTGGAITVNVQSTRTSSVTVRECMFFNNSGIEKSGAIHVFSGQRSQSTMTIISSTFDSNTVTRVSSRAVISIPGGAVTCPGDSITISHSTFTNNIGGDGGAVLASSTRSKFVSILDSTFTENEASFGRSGGALHFARGDANILINNSTFKRNSADGSGGAVYLRQGSTNVSAVDSAFINNSATHCGVLDVQSIGHHRIDIYNGVFTKNSATGGVSGNQDGGVFCVRNAFVSVMKSAFSYNSAAGDAGVMQIEESTVKVTGSTFNSNTAGFNGGVVNTKLDHSTFVLEQNSFSNNRAGDDGGVLYVGRAGSQVSVDQCVFNFNEASDRGGVVFIIESTMDVNNTEFINNTAALGGIIRSCNSDITLSDELFTSVDPLQTMCILYDHVIITATQAGSSTTATQAEPSTTASQAEPNTTASQAEPSTTATQAEPSTTATQDEPSTTASRDQAEISTTATQAEISTTTTSATTNNGAKVVMDLTVISLTLLCMLFY